MVDYSFNSPQFALAFAQGRSDQQDRMAMLERMQMDRDAAALDAQVTQQNMGFAAEQQGWARDDREMMMQDRIAQQQAAEAERQRGMQMRADLVALATAMANGTATHADLMMFSTAYPEVSDSVKASFEAYDEDSRRQSAIDAGQAYSALRAGRPEVAIGLLERRIAAARDAGDTETVELSQMAIDQINLSPEAGLMMLGVTLQELNPDMAKAVMDAGRGPTFRPATAAEAAQYGAAAGQFNTETGEFKAISPPSGMSVRTNADGTTEIVQGPGVGSGPPARLTEQQSKDIGFYNRMTGAAPQLDASELALTGVADNAAASVPVLGSFVTSEEYKLGIQAAKEWLAPVLRKDTGAAVTDQELQTYSAIYIPAMNDTPAVLAQKRAARKRAEDGVRAGLGAAEMLAREEELRRSGNGVPSGTDAGSQVPPQPAIAGLGATVLRYNPETGDFE